MYIFKTNADRTYIIFSKENVNRNVEEIAELFPLKRLMDRTQAFEQRKAT